MARYDDRWEDGRREDYRDDGRYGYDRRADDRHDPRRRREAWEGPAYGENPYEGDRYRNAALGNYGDEGSYGGSRWRDGEGGNYVTGLGRQGYGGRGHDGGGDRILSYRDGRFGPTSARRFNEEGWYGGPDRYSDDYPAAGGAADRSVDPDRRRESGGIRDPEYVAWRERQLGEYDRQYRDWRAAQARSYDEEYGAWRKERDDRFHREFSSWREKREGGGSDSDGSGESGRTYGVGSMAPAAGVIADEMDKTEGEDA